MYQEPVWFQHPGVLLLVTCWLGPTPGTSADVHGVPAHPDCLQEAVKALNSQLDSPHFLNQLDVNTEKLWPQDKLTRALQQGPTQHWKEPQ
jgi:hypothetical protein